MTTSPPTGEIWVPLVAYPGDVLTLPSWSTQVTEGLIAADVTFG